MSVLIVTTDKVYLGSSMLAGYSEQDTLSGSDPYSVSKAVTNLLAQSWVKPFELRNVNTAKAVNVIGGDWNHDTFIPDIARAMEKNKVPLLRFPNFFAPGNTCSTFLRILLFYYV